MIDPSISTFLITLLNIGILFVVLRAVLFKPVTRFMRERTQKVQDTIAQAHKAEAQAQALLKDYQERLAQAEETGKTLIKAAQEQAQKEAARIVAQGKAEAEVLLERGRKQLEAEREAALSCFRAEAAALVIGATSALLKRELIGEDSRRFAGLALQELGRDSHG
ncbi:MAG: ATP synthase F0 subunit B [Spirochaetaceae bacterium]|jgi:F-type H+-transporting ATPase subunit b|nr:ATP synthase F0 subunit B [Spirochaetaceae bacterium]